MTSDGSLDYAQPDQCASAITMSFGERRDGAWIRVAHHIRCDLDGGHGPDHEGAALLGTPIGTTRIPIRWNAPAPVAPSPLERVAALIDAGQIRVCRQSKPLTEHDARLLLEFHELLSNQPPKETP